MAPDSSIRAGRVANDAVLPRPKHISEGRQLVRGQEGRRLPSRSVGIVSYRSSTKRVRTTMDMRCYRPEHESRQRHVRLRKGR